MRELAKFQAGAGNDAAAELRWLGVQAGFIERAGERRNVFFLHIEEEQFLHRSGADAADAELFGHVRNGDELLTGGVAHGGFYADVELAVFLAVHAKVIAGTRLDLQWDAIQKRLVQVFFLQHLAELFDAPLGYQELQAGTVAIAAEAVVTEDADHTGPDLWHAL